jgi:hypothetical protein
LPERLVEVGDVIHDHRRAGYTVKLLDVVREGVLTKKRRREGQMGSRCEVIHDLRHGSSLVRRSWDREVRQYAYRTRVTTGIPRAGQVTGGNVLRGMCGRVLCLVEAVREHSHGHACAVHTEHLPRAGSLEDGVTFGRHRAAVVDRWFARR